MVMSFIFSLFYMYNYIPNIFLEHSEIKISFLFVCSDQ